MNNFGKYIKQINLKGFGVESQLKLQQAKVLVVGAGGLGCPALLYLHGMGVGKLGIIDYDLVQESNIHRQILYSIYDIGLLKVECAKKALLQRHQDCEIQIYPEKLTNSNALQIFKGYDLVIDGSDNFETRYLVNDACVLSDIPYIYGSLFNYEGQLGVFNLNNQSVKTNYRDAFPVPPLPGTIPSCEEGGILAVYPGMVGSWQAAEAVKILTGIGEPLCNQIFTFNFLNNRSYTMHIKPLPSTPILTEETFRSHHYFFNCR